MARILHDGEWYEQLSTEALYEEEYERLILTHAPELFPNYIIVPFKMLVYSEIAGAKADFALVHRKYRDWWVVEVEMSHHPFGGHVRPQVETLSRAKYDETVAGYLCAAEHALDPEKMHSVVKGQQPRVLVIVNAPVPAWDLRSLRALITIFEIFRSRHNKHLYRLNGEHPSAITSSEIFSDCHVELARFLRVHSPGILPIQHSENMEIVFRGGVTIWSRMDLSDCVYLTCAKPVSLNARMVYQIRQREDGAFVLQEKPKE